MNFTLSIKKNSSIIWIVVGAYLFEQYFMTPQYFLMLELLLIVLLMITSRRIIFPKIVGIGPYLAYILFISVMGLTKYGFSLVQRDLFYQLGSIVTMALGYYLYMIYGGERKSLWSTVCLMLLITSVICLIRGVFSLTGEMEFSDLRNTFGVGVKAISLFLPLLAGKRIILREKTLPSQLDIVTIVLWILQSILNLSRTAVINIIISSVVFILAVIIKRKINGRAIARVIVFAIIVVLMLSIIPRFLPEEATDTFSNKVDNMFTEMDKENQYRDIASAQADWRGYEISQAVKQWKKENVLTQIFGAGNGRIISIYFVPDHWQKIVERQGNITGVTILHNTYYTLLIKGGIVSIILLLFFLLMNAKISFKMMKNDKLFFEGVILLSIVLYILIDGYAVRTMIEREEEIAPMLLIGYINAMYYRSINEEVEENEEIQ